MSFGLIDKVLCCQKKIQNIVCIFCCLYFLLDYLENLETLKQNLSFPTQNDMVGSTLALVRLQETYQLDVSQVASGILNGVKYGWVYVWDVF